MVSGSKNASWKGDRVGYSGIHMWVRHHKPKTGRCSDCGTTSASRTEWANVSGEYRRDLNDYVELCPVCHKRRHGYTLKHGTLGGYTFHKCRCAACRQARLDWQRDYTRRKRGAVS